MDDAVREILTAVYEDALRILQENGNALDALVTALLEKEEITRTEVEEICGIS